MIRILHTGDWHLGHKFGGYPRYDEYDHFFVQLRDIIRDKSPDLMVVSGDIFENLIPDATTIDLFESALCSFFKVSKKLVIAIISGNHDNGDFLESLCIRQNQQRLWVCGKIHVRDNRYDVKSHVRTIHSRKIGAIGHLVLLPFRIEDDYPRLAGSPSDVTPSQQFFSTLKEQLDQLQNNQVPTIVVAHGIYGSKTNKATHECDQVPSAVNLLQPSYLALGHIHRIKYGPNNLYAYCGSPYPVNPSENLTHYALWVEVNPSQPAPTIQPIQLTTKRQFVFFPEKPANPTDVLNKIADAGNQLPDYYGLRVLKPSTKKEMLLFKTKLRELAQRYPVRICSITWFRDDKTEVEEFTVAQITCGSNHSSTSGTLHLHVIRHYLERIVEAQQLLVDHYTNAMMEIPPLCKKWQRSKLSCDVTTPLQEKLYATITGKMADISSEIANLQKQITSDSFQLEKALLGKYGILDSDESKLRQLPHFVAIYDAFRQRMGILEYWLQQYSEQHERRQLLVTTLQCKSETSVNPKKYMDLLASNTKISEKEQNQLQQMGSISNRCSTILGNAASITTVSAPRGNLLELWQQLNKELMQKEDEIHYLISVAKKHQGLEQRLEELKCMYKAYTEIQAFLKTTTEKGGMNAPNEPDVMGQWIEVLNRQQVLLEHTYAVLDREMEETQRLLNQIEQL